MRVVVNGEERDMPVDATVSAVVAAARGGTQVDGLAVAVDGDVVPRGEWEATVLEEGQRVEVLRAVQGGS